MMTPKFKRWLCPELMYLLALIMFFVWAFSITPKQSGLVTVAENTGTCAHCGQETKVIIQERKGEK